MSLRKFQFLSLFTGPDMVEPGQGLMSVELRSQAACLLLFRRARLKGEREMAEDSSLNKLLLFGSQ